MCYYVELLHSDAHYATPTHLSMDLGRKDALVLAHTKWPNVVYMLACSAWSELQETGYLWIKLQNYFVII